METREQMEARLRTEAEIRKEIEAEQAAEAKKKKRKKTARNYFIGLSAILLLSQGFERVINWMDPEAHYVFETSGMLFILALLIIIYTFVFFCIKEVYFIFD